MKGELTMSKKEIDRITVLEKSINKRITDKEGAVTIGITERHFRRLKAKYKKDGVKGIVHKSRGKPSNRLITQEVKDYAIGIVNEKYKDFGPTLAHEKLIEHGVELSTETLRKEMIKAGLWKSRGKKKNLHQLRERRHQEGELVQVDGSPHAWFEDRADSCVLLVYIDDASGKVLQLKFAESESTRSYFIATEEYIEIHGRPLSFYVDKHSVFRVNTTKVDSASLDDSNGDTQFGRAMRELEIDLIFANTPQAKGRVERVNQTLQDRLVKEMRLLGISSIEEGNAYLPQFIDEFNKRFSVEPISKINAHRPLLKSQILTDILCIKETRVLSKDLTMQYKNKTIQIEVEDGYEYTLRRVQVNVLELSDGSIQIMYKEQKLSYSIMNLAKSTRVYDSKQVNKRVDKIKLNQGHSYQFNLLGRTFLLWRKPDISTWG